MKFLFENWRKYLNEEQEVDEGWGKTLGTAALGLSMLGGAGAKADPGPGAGSFSTDTLSFDVRDVDPPTEEERQESLTAQIKDILLHGGTLRSIAREVMSRKDLKKFLDTIDPQDATEIRSLIKKAQNPKTYRT